MFFLHSPPDWTLEWGLWRLPKRRTIRKEQHCDDSIFLFHIWKHWWVYVKETKMKWSVCPSLTLKPVRPWNGTKVGEEEAVIFPPGTGCPEKTHFQARQQQTPCWEQSYTGLGHLVLVIGRVFFRGWNIFFFFFLAPISEGLLSRW